MQIRDAPKARPWQLDDHKVAVTHAGNSGQELGDNWVTHAHEPKMNPPKGISETEIDAIEWARSQFSAKWNTAVAAKEATIRDGLYRANLGE